MKSALFVWRLGFTGARRLLYALFLLAGVAQTAIVPLLPRLSAAYALSGTQTGLLLALPGLATMAVSVPAGVAADRFGSRRVSIAAGLLLALSCLLTAVPSLAAILAGRLLFGIAYGVAWTTAITWLSQLDATPGNDTLGPAVTLSSVGIMAGPAIGGLLAQYAGLALPFVLMAAVTGAVMAGLAVSRPHVTRRLALPDAAAYPALPQDTAEFAIVATADAVADAGLQPPQPVAQAPTGLRALPSLIRRPGVFAATGALAVSGAVSGVSQLLVSSGLHQAGLSSGRIGLAFSAAAIAYILVSTAVVRLGGRVRTLRFNALATAALAAGLLPALSGSSAPALILALVLTAGPRAAVSTISFALATDGSGDGADSRESVADGTIFGMLNGAWAAAMVAMPLIAGWVAQHGGAPVGYLAVIVPGTAMALWLAHRAGFRLRVGSRPVEYAVHDVGGIDDLAEIGALLGRVTLTAMEGDEDEQRGRKRGNVLGVVAGARPRLRGREAKLSGRRQRGVDQATVHRHRLTGSSERHVGSQSSGSADARHGVTQRRLDPSQRLRGHSAHVDEQ